MEILNSQISENGEDRLTSSASAFLASHFPVQESDTESQTTATSGRKCLEPSEKYDRIGLLRKTLLESSQWFCKVRKLRWVVIPIYSERITYRQKQLNNISSTESTTILSQSDTKFNCLLYQLALSGHRTNVTEFGSLPILLPTICSSEGMKYCTTYNPGSQIGTSLTALALNGLLPTPLYRDFRNGSPLNSVRSNRKIQEGLTIDLNDLAVMNLLPTPTARDYKGAATMENLQTRGRNNQTNCLTDYFAQSGRTFQLNPRFVRNDGFSDRLSGITFSQWRTGAIKALGNAIVTEVAFRIFKAIELADAAFSNDLTSSIK